MPFSKSLFVLMFLSFLMPVAMAGPGDTLHVITHSRVTVVTDPSTGLKSYPRWGVFPASGVGVRKIIMHVGFGCPDSLRCADWDYSDRISIDRKGGVKGKVQDYELARMLTPYGGAFAKDWNFSWEVDVTDFSLLLHDSVEINYQHSGYEANNDRGWAITVDFEIVTGKPALEPVSIQKIYDGHFAYGDSLNPIEKKLTPVTVEGSVQASLGRLRLVQTGHGMDEIDGCGEFCSKYRQVWVDGKMLDQRAMWKECGDNPLYPQAGTWIYDRANWCPGYLTQPDIIDFPIQPGARHSIYVAMQTYNSPKPSANEVISAYLIQYRKPEAGYDVSVEDIMVPSLKSIYKRINPSGANPRILIKNNGSQEIHHLMVHYGTSGFPLSSYKWTGLLSSGKMTEIALPGLIAAKSGTNTFVVSLENPEGKKDEYPRDNQQSSQFAAPPVHDTVLVFSLLTNMEPMHNAYQVISSDGKILFERKMGSLSPQTLYTDTLRMVPGAYQLAFSDTAGDGLEFWFNREGGRGMAQLLDRRGNLLKAFESDCGNGWIYNFMTGPHPDAVDLSNSAISLYPTRTTDVTTLEYLANQKEDVKVQLIIDPGAVVVEEHFYPQLREGSFTYDLRHYPKGRFYLKLMAGGVEKFKKRIRYLDEADMHPEMKYAWPSDTLVSQKLHQWQDWKFGVIIHWGAYSEWGVVESWSLCPEDEGWCVRRGPFANDYHLYKTEYEKIRKTFNPVKFNPSGWARAAHCAGMRYVVFTTKHHDGFCMFDSKYTDYKITDPGSLFSANPKSNVVKEVFKAFREEGLGIGAYFSKPDWHNQDYWWPYFPVYDRNVNYDPVRYPEHWKAFQTFTRNQIGELMTDYGKIDILWLDGGWVRPAGSLTAETRPWLGKRQWIQDVNIPSIATMARKYQPGLLIVDRTIHGDYENYRTPEQQIPTEVPDYPWESCITLGDSWYSTGPAEHYKSVTWAIHTLVKIVAKGGNFLLGVGPDKSGDLVPEVYERLEGIGKWMDVNQQAIYNTKPLKPCQSGKLCFTQSKDEKTRYALYLLEENEMLPAKLVLPEAFIGNNSEVGILGSTQKIPVKTINGKRTLCIPSSLQKKLKTQAAVFYVPHSIKP